MTNKIASEALTSLRKRPLAWRLNNNLNVEVFVAEGEAADLDDAWIERRRRELAERVREASGDRIATETADNNAQSEWLERSHECECD